MTVENNKELIRRFYDEFYNGRNFEAVDHAYAQDYVHHTPDVLGQELNFPDFRSRELKRSNAFPDLERSIEDQIGEGDKVVTRSVMRGTQSGNMPDIPASGRKIEVWFTVVNRIENGKIAEGWETYDSLGMMLQLDIIHMVTTLGKSKAERGYYPPGDYNV